MAAKLTQAERMIRVETNLSNLDKKLEEGMAEIKGSIKELSIQFNLAIPTFVTQPVMTEKIALLEKELIEMKRDVISAKRKSSWQTFVTSSLSAVLAVVLTILIQDYFRG